MARVLPEDEGPNLLFLHFFSRLCCICLILNATIYLILTSFSPLTNISDLPLESNTNFTLDNLTNLAYFVQAHEEYVAVFTSNLILLIPVQNLSKRFFDMFIKIFTAANMEKIREYAEGNILYVLMPSNTKICNTWLGY